MIYRPEQKEGAGKSESCNEYWTRKQSTNINRVMGDGDLPTMSATKDRDAEVNASKWEGAAQKDRWGKSATIWDDEPWKDKDQGRGS